MSLTTDNYQKLVDSQQYTISKITHELRNPLALAYSTFQLIETQHPEVTSFKHWEQLREDLDFMIQLLQELSLFNNSNQLHKQLFSSYEWLSRVCLSFVATCENETISFSSLLPNDLPYITGDKLKLQEAILNLLRNAKDAITESGSITLKAFVEKSFLIIQISDNGCGIAPEYMETLFDPFVTYKEDGTGLGLSIVKSVILAHGGSIDVQSKVAAGSCFTLKLPV